MIFSSCLVQIRSILEKFIIYLFDNMYIQQHPYHNILNQVKAQRLHLAHSILDSKLINYNGHKMRFEYFIHGEKPIDGYRLVFGFHGGGGCPPEVNEQQWNNHKHLYDQVLPDGTIWFVPRSAEQASDMWWKSYIPEIITLIVQSFSIVDMIDTNRVFITGYSAGGDGIYHVASMLADILAGAVMMAGHPNKADCYNLRNIAFSVQVGDHDKAYDRANWGRVYIDKINELRKQYGGFKQYSKIHEHSHHWMEKKDAMILPQFLNETRNPYPEFILFRQHPRTFKSTFYYIKIQQKHRGLICVRRKGNHFQIQSQQKIPIKILLNSRFIDFNQEVVIYHNGDLTLKYRPTPSLDIVRQSAEEFVDSWYIFEDEIVSIPMIDLPKDYKVLRPFDMQNCHSSIQKIKQMQECISENEQLHVTLKPKRRHQIQGLNPNEDGVFYRNDQPNEYTRSIQHRIKRLQQTCEQFCTIF